MVFWFFVIVLTLSAVLSVVLPIVVRQRRVVVDETHDRAVYLDQLAELQRERDDGRIGDDEADVARAEIARRLIGADKAAADRRPWAGGPLAARAVAMIAVAGIPIVALSAYYLSGSPELPPRPLAARTSVPAEDQDIRVLVARAEKHLAENPEDGRGWEVLAPIYMRLERFTEAATAFRNVIRLSEPTSDRFANLGEAVMAVENGIVTREARRAFEQAAELDAGNIKARYYLAVALQQDGKPEAAADRYRQILADSPSDAPWRSFVEHSLAGVEPREEAPGPTQEQVTAAARMSDNERAEMIEGMVSRLADRLEQQPADPDGWVRLVRAYLVLERREDAVKAAGKALEAIDDANARANVRQQFIALGLAPEETSSE